MITLELERYSYFDRWTQGRLLVHGAVYQTMELGWKKNAAEKSCIPEGLYPMTRRWTEERGDHWLIENVPDRSLILIHPANWWFELRGCIAPGIGQTWDPKNGCPMVTKSRAALALINQQLAGVEEVNLLIRPYRAN